MFIGLFSNDTAPGCAIDESDLQEIWLIHIFEGDRFFADKKD